MRGTDGNVGAELLACRFCYVGDSIADLSRRFVLGQIRCEGLNGVPLAVVPKSRRTWNVTADDRKTHFLRSFLVYAGINAGRFDFAVPYWFLVFLSGTIAAILWKKREKRFSLRRLFIVTTFLAVVLGMIAWLDRAWIGK